MAKKLRVLITSQVIPGHLNPMLAVGAQLRDRGHEIAFYTGARAEPKVVARGYPIFRMNPDADRHLEGIIYPDDHGGASTVADRPSLFDLGAPARAMKAWFLETIPQQVEDLEGAIAEFRPDVLLCDTTLFGPLLVLNEKHPEINFVVLSVVPPCPIPGPDAPPWGMGLPSARGGFGKLRNETVRRVSRLLLRDYNRAANRLRGQHGLPPIEGPIAEVYVRTARFLVCGAPSFDFNRQDLPSNVYYVGLCAEPVPESEIPDWLKRLPEGRPVVHVTEGTVHTSRPLLLEAAIRGLSGQPYDVVIGTGGREPDTLDIGPIGDNIRVEKFVPHEPLFARSEALITTGSAGTICKGFIAGLPQVIVPIGWEHAENAQRMAEAGAGIRLDPKKCNPETVRRALKDLLGDPEYSRNAKRIGADLEACGGAARAADHVEAAARV